MDPRQDGEPVSEESENSPTPPLNNQDPDLETSSRVEELAVEYLDRVSAGEHPDTDRYLSQLETDAERRELEEILRYAMTVESVLPPVIEVGETLGPYDLKEEFQAGAMGRVFRAYDRSLNREVAVKILPPHHGGPMFRQAFQNEAQALARLNHPNIVGIHEAGAVKGIDYLVMDFVDGRPLGDVLESLNDRVLDRLKGSHLTEAIGKEADEGRDSLDEDDWYRTVSQVMRRICQGLEAAHARNLLHRDLKPSNIILQGGGNPVVLDFGLASASDRPSAEMTEGLYGTAPYMAPEQIRTGKTGASPLTDVYQLGLILYEMITLRRAFPGENISDVTIKVGEGEFIWPRKINPNIPEDLEAICLKATNVAQGQRYASVADLRKDLDRFLAGEPTVARPPNAIRKTLRVLRRHRGLAAVLIALVSGGLLATTLLGPEQDLAEIGGLAMRGDGVFKLRNGELVNKGDFLGFEIDLQRPATVYCLSFVAEDGHVKAVRPHAPVTIDEVKAGDLDHPLGRQWDAGSHRLLASVVIEDSKIDPESQQWNEGFFVLVSENDPEWTARWIDELNAEANQWDETIPYEDAIERLETIQDSLTRGGSLKGAMDPSQLAQSLPSLEYVNADDWTLDDPDLLVLNFVAQR